MSPLKIILLTCLYLTLLPTTNKCQLSNNSIHDSTRFSLKEINGNWWLVNPEGKPFFSRGVCCVNTGLSFDEYKTENPGYAAWQHFKDPMNWAQSTIDSLTSWSYTTLGGWCSMDIFSRLPKLNMYFTPVLAMGMTAGVPWFDMWEPAVVSNMDRIAKEIILKAKDNPNLIGYYSDNEMGWWNAAMWNMTLKDKPSSGARKRTIELIYNYYGGNWNKLLKDFDSEGANNFNELKNKGRLYLHPGGNGILVIKKFLLMFAERYYSLVHDIIRKYDKKALILGDRYQSFYYNEVARAASKYVDVISTNLNASWNDGILTRFYLSNLYELTHKPIAIGEYYMAANENMSGNKNSSATFPTVQTQKERVDGFLTTSKIIAQNPHIVMADWFQYYDEPTNGRFDGENYNMGLVDIYGKPYEELVNAAKIFEWEKYKSTPHVNLPDASEGIPPAPIENIVVQKGKEIIKNWNRINGFVKPVTQLPSADMYLCWNKDSLFVAVYGIDVVEKEYYKDGIIPEIDRTELIIDLGNSVPPVHIRLGANRKPEYSNKDINVFNSSGIFLSVNNMTIVKIPAGMFGKSKFEAGDKVTFSAVLNTFARSSTTKWKVDYLLSGK